MAQVLGISVGAPNLFGEATKSVLLVGIGKNGEEVGNTRARLQYFPESLSDSRAVNYETKEIPGGSHPLYQWVSGGERQLSLTAVFTQENRLVRDAAGVGFGLPAEVPSQNPFGVAFSPDKHSVDIRGAIAWLRQFTYPSYSQGLASPPLRVRLTFPGMRLSVVPGTAITSDSLMSIMTGCDVEYMQWWPDGVPKYATVSLSFSEIVQDPRKVQFQDASALNFLGQKLYVDSNSNVVRNG